MSVDPYRLINALQRDPALMYEVAKRIVGARILGPWEPFGYAQIGRRNTGGTVKVEVAKAAKPGSLWLADNLMTGSRINNLPSQEVAQAIADHYARVRGWTVVKPHTLDLLIHWKMTSAPPQWGVFNLKGEQVAWHGKLDDDSSWWWWGRGGRIGKAHQVSTRDEALTAVERWAIKQGLTLLSLKVGGLLDPRKPEKP